MTRVLVGVGTAAYLPCDLALPLVDGHPSTQAGIQIMLTVDDDVISRADVRIGLMHRSMEKLYEARDYRQLMMLADRQDWMSAFSTEVAIALAVENAMGIVVPERATLIRTLMAEATRAAATLSFVLPILHDSTVADTARRLSLDLTSVQEAASGSRVHPMHTRIGGVARDLDDATIAQYRQVTQDISAVADRVSLAVAESTSAHHGVATLTYTQAVQYSLFGPVGRASGLPRDVRLDTPYLAYADLSDALDYPHYSVGDIPARYAALTDQLAVSARLMIACLDRLSDMRGPIDVPLPKVVRVPEGTYLSSVEGPLGQVGCLLVSAGEKTPWRLKMRTPSFASAQALGPVLVGTSMPNLAAAVMSFFLSVGDIDR
jgi:NADH-quinone oxidoreductase subunit D